MVIGIVASAGPNDGELAVDSARYVIFPFQREAAAGSELTEARLRDAFGRWTGLSVVPELDVREALRRDTVPRSEPQAQALARGLGAGWYVRVLLSPVGDSLRVSAALYSATARGPPVAEHSLRLPATPQGADSVLVAIADALLMGESAPPDRVPDDRTTRSLQAARAVSAAHEALRSWDLAAAESIFVAATRHDDRYAQAHLWLALVRAWSGSDIARWRIAAEQAGLARVRFTDVDGAMADALLAQARGNLATSCELWRTLTLMEPQAYPVWYSYAQCLRSDDVVVPDPASPSGWRFRSSYAETLRAFRRAFELHPPILSGFRANAYQSLRSLLMTSSRTLQSGRSEAADGQRFRGRPVWSADSLVVLPYPVEIAAGSVAPWDPSAVQAAVSRQRDQFRDLALSWVTQYPRSAAAMHALGVSLEMVGSPAAVDTFRHARALASSRSDRLAAAASEIWIQVKLGVPDSHNRLRAAKRTADSILRDTIPPRSGDRVLAGLAALTGRGYLAASMLRQSAADEGWLPAALSDGPAFLVFASLGGPPDSLRSLDRAVASQLANPALPNRDALALEWRAGPAGLAAPTLLLPAVQEMRRAGDYLVDAFAAWAARDTGGVRRTLGELRQSRRSIPPADRAIDALYPEAVLLAWLGDEAGAIDWLDPTLNNLLQTAPGTFAYPARPGALIQAMALRSDLAARTGDGPGARRWAEPVVILWSDADGHLQPLVRRMRERTD
jgi:hypothetical protein